MKPRWIVRRHPRKFTPSRARRPSKARRSADEKTRPAAGGSPRARIPRGGGETFVARLRVFRQRFAGEPNASDQAQLYDFLSEWLIDALYED